MKCKKAMIVTLVLTAAMAAAPVFASSLWDNSGSLFADQKASGIGDIVTVKVAENIKDSDEGKVSSSKTTDDNINSGTGILDFIRTFGLGSSSSMSSNTKIERTKAITAVFSCLIVDVMPNGNMVIYGERTMLNGAEKMSVRYSGVVRPQDVAHNNTVDSSRVANAEMMVRGKGIVSRTQRPGLINQILQAIF
jgi:flagellar L-ring protein precursor FlgH